MIVCICNNVNSDTINSAINDGASTLQQVKEATSAGTCCGSCQFKINSLIQNKQPSDRPATEKQYQA